MPRIYSAAKLQNASIPEPRWIVPGFLHEGATLLAGQSKIGKSWLCLDLAVAVATGGRAFGHIAVEQGEVLYLALEDKPSRMKSRLGYLLADDEPWPSDMSVVHSWDKLDVNGLPWLEKWLAEHTRAALVIIDVYSLVKPIDRQGKNLYTSDHEWAAKLSKLAARHHVAVLIVHHTRKAPSADPFQLISGTEGLPAGVDTNAVLIRNPDSFNGSLWLRGREVETAKWSLRFDADRMQWIHEPSRLTPERQAILNVLAAVAPEPLKVTEIASQIGKSANTTRQLVYSMHGRGQIKQAARGAFFIVPDNNGNNGNSGNGLQSVLPVLPDIGVLAR